MFLFHYRPQKICEGYVFTHVCLYTEEEYLDRYPPWQIHPLGRYTPRQVHPPAGTLPWAGTPHPLGRYSPLQSSACWDTVNKQAVRILLECILVSTCTYMRAAFICASSVNQGKKQGKFAHKDPGLLCLFAHSVVLTILDKEQRTHHD